MMLMVVRPEAGEEPAGFFDLVAKKRQTEEYVREFFDLVGLPKEPTGEDVEEH